MVGRKVGGGVEEVMEGGWLVSRRSSGRGGGEGVRRVEGWKGKGRGFCW